MATSPVAGPLAASEAAPATAAAGHRAELRARALRLSVVPVALGVLAIAIAAGLGHVLAGLLFAVGLLLGAANGMAAQVATVWMATTDGVDRGTIVRNSLWRLAAITVVALVIAFLARPTGWVVLLGLAIYQLIATGAAAGATMRELRRG